MSGWDWCKWLLHEILCIHLLTMILSDRTLIFCGHFLTWVLRSWPLILICCVLFVCFAVFLLHVIWVLIVCVPYVGCPNCVLCLCLLLWFQVLTISLCGEMFMKNELSIAKQYILSVLFQLFQQLRTWIWYITTLTVFSNLFI